MTGRPSIYSDELAAEICARLAAGDPLTRICRCDGMPSMATVYLWLADPKKSVFLEMYTRAREDQADTLADQIVDIADGSERDALFAVLEDTSADAETIEAAARALNELVQRDRLRVDARKWIAAKLKPRKYGDKQQLEHSGKDGAPIDMQYTITLVSAESK